MATPTFPLALATWCPAARLLQCKRTGGLCAATAPTSWCVLPLQASPLTLVCRIAFCLTLSPPFFSHLLHPFSSLQNAGFHNIATLTADFDRINTNLASSPFGASYDGVVLPRFAAVHPYGCTYPELMAYFAMPGNAAPVTFTDYLVNYVTPYIERGDGDVAPAAAGAAPPVLNAAQRADRRERILERLAAQMRQLWATDRPNWLAKVSSGYDLALSQTNPAGVAARAAMVAPVANGLTIVQRMFSLYHLQSRAAHADFNLVDMPPALDRDGNAIARIVC